LCGPVPKGTRPECGGLAAPPKTKGPHHLLVQVRDTATRTADRYRFSCLLVVHDVGEKGAETPLWCSGVHHDMGDNGVQLLLGILVVVATPLAADTHPVWDVLNTLAPDSLVELRVHTNILGLHHLLSELANGTNSTRGALLEGAAVKALVEVDGVLAGNALLTHRFAGLLGHDVNYDSTFPSW